MSASTVHQMLNVLCPMHVVLDLEGVIHSAGPTAQKLVPSGELLGHGFLDVFEIKRPKALSSLEMLREKAGTKLHLQFREPPHRELKGVLMEGPEIGQMTVNLSFGISVVDAVQDFSLTAADFAATDLTIEMLYLVEAKSAAMEASRQLNERLQGARIEAEEQALTDALTGLQNRRGMDQTLDRLISSGEDFSLMHLDLDFFKAVNDTLGHAAGDYVLVKVAEIMTRETRDCDTVARVGGDEFVILVRGVVTDPVLNRIGSQIIKQMSRPMPFEGDVCKISGSIGTVKSSQYATPTADQLLGDADSALYASKHAGRGRQTFFDPKMRNVQQQVLPRDSSEAKSKTA